MCQKLATILRHLWLVKARELGRAKEQLQEAGGGARGRTFLPLRQI